MLNPFFLQGSSTEQGLVQDLINEQLRMYGIEVYYMPREIFSEGKVIRDVINSKFNNAFPIEAYLMNYEGFDANSVMMSKFGVKITDEMNLIISKERFELYISQLIKDIPNIKNSLRPNEGDLIYVPLSDSLMEIKFVENRKPFYQLQKNYVYELRCEVYEMDDSEINTGIADVDELVKDFGFNASLVLSGIGSTAVAYTSLVDGAIYKVDIINGGYGFTSTPKIIVSDPISGTTAKVSGVMTSSRSLLNKLSLDEIYIEDPGSGYTSNDKVILSFFGGGGYNITVSPKVATTGSIGVVTISSGGYGYANTPIVNFSSPGTGVTATGYAVLNASGSISQIRITNAGYGYTIPPTITIGAGSTVANGNFIFGEEVVGSISGAIGIVKNWNSPLKNLEVTGTGKDFIVGETIVGSTSSATYIIKEYTTFENQTEYNNNDVIEEEADKIIDFSEINPFGDV